MNEITKIILIALGSFLALCILIYILLESFNNSGYTDEQLRIYCNNGQMEEKGLNLLSCATIW